MKQLRQFHIHHATEPGLMFTETQVQPRQYVGFVQAESVGDAWLKSQNFDGPNWNGQSYPKRSTSVGDVIQDGDKFFMVKGLGFEELIEDEPDMATLADQQLNEDAGY